MRRYPIRDEAGNVIAAGCSRRPPTQADIAIVRAFSAWLQTQPPDPEMEARQEASRRRIHERLARHGMLRCQICGQPSRSSDECAACFVAEDAAAVRRADA